MSSSLPLVIRLVLSKVLPYFRIFFAFLAGVLFCLGGCEVWLGLGRLFRLVWIARILFIIYASFRYALVIVGLFVLVSLGFLSLATEIIVCRNLTYLVLHLVRLFRLLVRYCNWLFDQIAVVLKNYLRWGLVSFIETLVVIILEARVFIISYLLI